MTTLMPKPKILGKICPFCAKDAKTIIATIFLQVGTLLVWECPECGMQFDNKSGRKPLPA